LLDYYKFVHLMSPFKVDVGNLTARPIGTVNVLAGQTKS